VAYWSFKPGGKLIVFVHGFKGAAITTWIDFPGQLTLNKATQGYDMIFFGYDSVTQTAGESANDLQTCINDLLFKSSEVFNKSAENYDSDLRRPAGFCYDKLVLVGHSLGAVAIRAAMLAQLNGGKGSWPSATSIVLFAPAHKGAKIFRLLLAATLGMDRVVAIGKGATFFAPVLKDLKEGSKYLDRLETETIRDCVKYPQLNATKVFWRKKDKVVINDRFANDAMPAIEVPGATHISICKPIGYSDIVKDLLAEM
jgi:triacylglycerol esterase/lipase EstA (alpha/beta hydrolase family)